VKYHSTEELNLQVSCRDTIIASLTAACEDAKIDTLDGLTIEYMAGGLISGHQTRNR